MDYRSTYGFAMPLEVFELPDDAWLTQCGRRLNDGTYVSGTSLERRLPSKIRLYGGLLRQTHEAADQAVRVDESA